MECETVRKWSNNPTTVDKNINMEAISQCPSYYNQAIKSPPLKHCPASSGIDTLGCRHCPRGADSMARLYPIIPTRMWINYSIMIMHVRRYITLVLTSNPPQTLYEFHTLVSSTTSKYFLDNQSMDE